MLILQGCFHDARNASSVSQCSRKRKPRGLSHQETAVLGGSTFCKRKWECRRLLITLSMLMAMVQSFTTPIVSIQGKSHRSGRDWVYGGDTIAPCQRQLTATPRQPPRCSRTMLYKDLEERIKFGGEGQSGVSWGGNEGGDAGESYEAERKRQKELVQELVMQKERALKHERKLQKWGKFATANNATAVQSLLEEERKEIEEGFRQKVQLAEQMGVSIDILAPKEDTSEIWESDGLQLLPGSAKKQGSALFNEIDSELAEEWKALMTTGHRNAPKNGNDEEEDEDEDNLDVQEEEDDAIPSGVVMGSDGMVARERLSGVRVGSAGSWALEVFPGDFVVHRKYGIGRFEGTTLRPKTKLTEEEKEQQRQRRRELLAEQLRGFKKHEVTPETIQELQSKFGTEDDKDLISNPQVTVLEITYADATVHVPVDRAYRLSRFRSGDSVVKPKLTRVRGEAWKKAKERVEQTTMAVAQDVLALYATRETLRRNAFSPEKEHLVKEFETTFRFEPTPDQKRCFEDVENDMVWRKRPMDRLVCGDVGFGKTEIAIRALFRCISNGKQAAFLAPTGVLAAQHYKNVMARMGPDSKYGICIDLLRGTMSGKTTKFGREIRERVKTGETQLIVGTHSLLAKDLEYNNLGLLVVDEEQRFGVKQKERLKLICNGIDVLTLSATPIPRTLQMSLSGIRDTSTIRSPPPMRKPVITYVQEYSSNMVKKAISDELGRGGQCFYVVPRISMIKDAAETIQTLFPNIRMVVAHGRMLRNGAEENVAAFAEGKYDVLLATTVIENGVDIPSVNTIIVQNSQSFGMSTLYQLRGRVGRSDRQAYAYFLHREDGITEQASMRLQAIGELNELGSGFDVANRDLEIRGAGSLLGTEQSGLASKVGFDLYLRMLKKTVRKLRGLDLPLVPRTNVLIKTEGTPETFRIPFDYIEDDGVRQMEESNARLAASTTALVNTTSSWKESYGPIPTNVQAQLKTLHLHACTRPLGVDLLGLIEDGEGSNDCVMRSPGLRPRHIAMIVERLPRKALPKGLHVIFPARLTNSRFEEEFKAGDVRDMKRLLEDESLSEDREDEEWDTMDREETEAMNEISSAIDVKDMDEIDIEQYPRLVLKNFGTPKNAVDLMLKTLLPLAKVVYEIHEEQTENAKIAAAVRQKRKEIKEKGKANEELAAQRYGMEF